MSGSPARSNCDAVRSASRSSGSCSAGLPVRSVAFAVAAKSARNSFCRSIGIPSDSIMYVEVQL